MMNTLIDVETEDGTMLAKIVDVSKNTFSIRYLLPTHRYHIDSQIYDYDDEVDEIDKSCVSGYYDTADESEAGFVMLEQGGFVEMDSDDEYEPSESEDESEDESCDESDESDED